MSRSIIETVMGAVVLVIAAVFLFFAYNVSQVPAVEGYELTAQFERVDGLREGSDVRIGGIKVGSIISEALDPKTYLAIVKMSISSSIKLPVDTVAQITSNALLGSDKYLELIPGGADEVIPWGGRITYTKPAINLETLIGQYIFGPQKSQKNSDDGDSSAGKPK
jgi:phospholipid/cholesterol/gamma-HCH transport system substrate-binding protein